MQYALINEQRCEASPRGRGVCPQCRGVVIAKCGGIVVHHWAHESKVDCDPWWEPETPWHRRWKSYARNVEVTIADHRADIVTSNGLLVELQHSPISVDDIQAREACYGQRLRWLFDGTNLSVNVPGLATLCAEPHPVGVFHQQNGPSIRYFESRYGIAKQWNDGYSWCSYNASLELRPKEGQHKDGWEVVTFRWRHPRLSYAEVTCPAYIDLPGKYVLKLMNFHVREGPPYGGWGYLIPRETVIGWL